MTHLFFVFKWGAYFLNIPPPSKTPRHTFFFARDFFGVLGEMKSKQIKHTLRTRVKLNMGCIYSQQPPYIYIIETGCDTNGRR